MAVALDRGPTYFGTHLSDNIAETPEGFLICRNAVIGRSGFQTYAVRELDDPGGLLADYSDDDEVQIWRDPSEVFSTATLGSFEGKSITLTHPDALLTPESDGEHNVGHAQNVRKGSEALESGDWPMVADIIVKDADAIRQVKSGLRELSCGYAYKLAREGNRFDQRSIWGNHIALVPKGRAGHEARINDTLPSKGHKVKKTWKEIFGIGVKEYAKDASPEDLSSVINEFHAAGAPAQNPKRGKVIGITSGGEEIFSIAKDEETPSMDKKAMDRKKMHDALDARMDAADAEEAAKSEEADASMDALSKLFGAKDAEEHPDDCDCKDCKAGKDAESTVEEGSDGEVTSPEPTLTPEEVPQTQLDSAQALVDALKPHMAKTKDAKIKKAFNTAVTALDAAKAKASKGTNGGYGAVIAATRIHANDSMENESAAQKEVKRIDDMYADEMKSRTKHFRPASQK